VRNDENMKRIMFFMEHPIVAIERILYGTAWFPFPIDLRRPWKSFQLL